MAGSVTYGSRIHGTAAWNTAGCEGIGTDRTAVSASTSEFTGTGWLDLNVTEWCEDWLVDGASNYGLWISDERDCLDRGSFYSVEYTTNTALRPTLTIEYEAGGATYDEGCSAGVDAGLSVACTLTIGTSALAGVSVDGGPVGTILLNAFSAITANAGAQSLGTRLILAALEASPKACEEFNIAIDKFSSKIFHS